MPSTCLGFTATPAEFGLVAQAVDRERASRVVASEFSDTRHAAATQCSWGNVDGISPRGATLSARPRSVQPGPPGRRPSFRPSPVPSRPTGCDSKGLLGAAASVRGVGRRCRRPLATGCTGGRRRIPHVPGGGSRFFRSWQTGAVLSLDYVQRSEHRLCEPRYCRLYLRQQRERQPRLGAGQTLE